MFDEIEVGLYAQPPYQLLGYEPPALILLEWYNIRQPIG